MPGVASLLDQEEEHVLTDRMATKYELSWLQDLCPFMRLKIVVCLVFSGLEFGGFLGGQIQPNAC